MLEEFLAVIHQHPDLAHFRAAVRTGPERQLALIAAFERAVIVGSPVVAPPSPDDQADLLLCDILDVIDRQHDLKSAYHGPGRYLANLQALGIWRGTDPINTPTAHELFTTSFSHLTTDPVTDLPSSQSNYSPASQVFGQNGELIGPSTGTEGPAAERPSSPQTIDGVLVVEADSLSGNSLQPADSPGIIHHSVQNPGDKCSDAPVGWDKFAQASAGPPSSAPPAVPVRPVRRGRPVKLDDLAKGRLLGLMSLGLSFRQAAAQLGVHHVTLLNMMKRDEEFSQQVSEARLDAISQPLLTVVQASRTNWRAAAWLAKFLEERRVNSLETTPEERKLDSIKQR
jgi:hypothetical protein